MKEKEKHLKKIKTPWPTKDAMSQIYKKNLWGEDNSKFYSGEGSHDPGIIDPYLNALKFFLSSFRKPLIVCDLGCGDFNVGKELVPYSRKYVAVDIVEDLIMYNIANFKANNLKFEHLDIASQPLPAGDCAILRQVLQHLSNEEVTKIVDKLSQFKYVVLTEHLPTGEFIPNKNIISGQGNRVKLNSGINLLAPPFNLIVKEEQPLVTIPLDGNRGIIKTVLYRMC